MSDKPKFTIEYIPVGKRVAKSRELLDFLKGTLSHLRNDIEILEHINLIMPEASDRYSNIKREELRKRIEELDDEGKKQYETYYKFGSSLAEATNLKKEPPKILHITHEGVADILSDMNLAFLLSGRMPMFIREMSLVYLVISFEGFLSRTLHAVLYYKPESLKSVKKL